MKAATIAAAAGPTLAAAAARIALVSVAVQHAALGYDIAIVNIAIIKAADVVCVKG